MQTEFVWTFVFDIELISLEQFEKQNKNENEKKRERKQNAKKMYWFVVSVKCIENYYMCTIVSKLFALNLQAKKTKREECF